MRQASAFALTVAILLSGTTRAESMPNNSPVAPARVSEPAVPEQVVYADSPELQDLADCALSRYTQAGLALPGLEIYFHDSKAPCNSHNALHNRTETGSVINVCSTQRSPKLEATILHELGHAWAAHNLTNTQQQAFVDHQGLDTWYHREVDWNERGTEQAAEIVGWGVSERQWPPRWIPNNDPDSLTAAYQQLVGATPLMG